MFIPLGVFFAVFYRRHIKKQKTLIFLAVCLGILMDIVEDILGIHWQAWIYDTNKSLGIIPPGINIDTLVFGIGVAVTLAIMVSILAEREEKKKPFLRLIETTKKRQ